MADEKDVVEDQVSSEVEKTEDEGVNQPSNEEVLADLRSRLDAERTARVNAENAAIQNARLAQQSATQVDNTNLQLVSNAIDTVRRENEILKANYRSALSEDNYDVAAEAQERMSINAAKLLQLENGKAAMEAEPRQRQPVHEVQRTVDPVEAFASQLTPRSASWVRRNPQFVTDPRLNQKMIAAHNLAMADGHEADSDSYFSSVEETLKVNRRNESHQDQESALSSASSPAQRRASPPAAPVSRSGTGNGVRANQHTLSAAEREMAEFMQMSEEDYAKNKNELRKSGRMN
ncbi:hypothetical protein UFOVP1301_43 [uncultured Caudovirales phage]|uniref:Uncharacterized protein n=1 Tax=uncultured Caudovirales phage TaxID=2100421 RepID=A0A6J5QB14_9CAUD|nr:hypothetical protein UFOVP663_28 [uncultured Caudovirales phage]CAB4168602.1 hypothetical protein UFOVP894_4 [uncultured Caudovirales phage]CAB4181253.1 hypothetical protein UFOVP1069_24 [uncultured Caudovirales phage]CAB4195921.1 hypothetical protein UFOVP1301_43 [uncultured Caudovirales phage]CAB4211051.1 hypothetical protein UFOVP1415_71 [uncultured Caudovirales phage]